MAIDSVDEIWESRSCNYDAKFIRTYRRKFRVLVDTTADHTVAILADGDIPANLEAHPVDAAALVSNRKVTNASEDPLIYFVDVDYSTAFDLDPSFYADSPLDRLPITEYSFEKVSKAVQYDIDDNAIDNSAEVPISPPVEMEISLMVLTIHKNYDPGAVPGLPALQDVVNSDLWVWDSQTFDIGSVKIRSAVPSKVMKENGVSFVTVTYVLVVKWDLWRPWRLLDIGYSELIDGVNKTIRNVSGILPNPSRLDGNGLKLEAGEPPVFLEFNLHREMAFTGTVP